MERERNGERKKMEGDGERKREGVKERKRDKSVARHASVATDCMITSSILLHTVQCTLIYTRNTYTQEMPCAVTPCVVRSVKSGKNC